MKESSLTIKTTTGSKTRVAEIIKELDEEVVSNKFKKTKKESLLSEIKQGLNDLELIRQGKVKSLSMSDLLSGK